MKHPIEQSQYLVIKQLVNYANLPLSKKRLCDPKTGDFLFVLKKRRGCHLTEKQLLNEMQDSFRSVLRELDVSIETKKAYRNMATHADVERMKELLEEIINKCAMS